MDEKKRSFIILGVIAACLFLLILIGVIQNENDKSNDTNETTKTYKGQYTTNYNEAFEGEGKKVLYIGSSSCGVCTEFTPYMQYLSEAYDFTYFYIDAGTMDTTELIEVLEKVGQDIDNFGTPYIAYIENGKKYNELSGYVTESGLFDNLQENGIIGIEDTYVSSNEAPSSDLNEEDSNYNNLSFIDYDEYKELYEGDKRFALVLGQSGCGACSSYKPIINEIAKEEDVQIYYVDMNQLVDSEPYQIMATLSYFDNIESWGTPLTLIVEDTKVIDSLEGYNDKEITKDFLKKNKLIK